MAWRRRAHCPWRRARGGLESSGAVRDEYQFAVEVSGAAACGWVESWIAAKRAGDASAMQAAARIARDRLDHGPAGISVEADGSAYEFGPQWSLALGCDPHWRVPVDPTAPSGNRRLPGGG